MWNTQRVSKKLGKKELPWSRCLFTAIDTATKTTTAHLMKCFVLVDASFPVLQTASLSLLVLTQQVFLRGAFLDLPDQVDALPTPHVLFSLFTFKNKPTALVYVCLIDQCQLPSALLIWGFGYEFHHSNTYPDLESGPQGYVWEVPLSWVPSFIEDPPAC